MSGSGSIAARSPDDRLPTFVSVGTWAFAIGVGIVGVLVTVFARRGGPTLQDAVWAPATAIAFATVGAIIVNQRPGNVIGRLCLVIGLLLGLNVALTGIAAFVDARPGPLPAPFVVFALASGPLQWIGLALIAALLARFPVGRLPSPPWRVIDAIVGLFAIVVSLTMFLPGEISIDWLLPTENPIGVLPQPPEDLGEAIWVVALMLLWPIVLAFILAIVALGLQYRRAEQGGRAQIRWVVAAVGLFFVGLTLSAIGTPFDELTWALVLVSPVAIPVGIGIAVTRYRLYEIDRIVSRTISYAAVTAILAATFIGANVTLQFALRPALGDDTIAVAMSTLVVAMLFAPVRSRVQGVVDRRFNRARIDAERAAARFADQLRDEVDLTALRRGTLAAVTGAVEPRDAALWLRHAGYPEPSPDAVL